MALVRVSQVSVACRHAQRVADNARQAQIEALRQARDHGWTYRDLGRASGLDHGLIHRLINDNRKGS